MRNDLSVVITLLLLVFAVLLVVRVFWPVLLVLAIGIFILYLKNKHDIKKAEEEEIQAQEDLESELFREQVARKKRENAEVIEAEFVEKEDNQYDHH